MDLGAGLCKGEVWGGETENWKLDTGYWGRLSQRREDRKGEAGYWKLETGLWGEVLKCGRSKVLACGDGGAAREGIRDAHSVGARR